MIVRQMDEGRAERGQHESGDEAGREYAPEFVVGEVRIGREAKPARCPEAEGDAIGKEELPTVPVRLAPGRIGSRVDRTCGARRSHDGDEGCGDRKGRGVAEHVGHPPGLTVGVARDPAAGPAGGNCGHAAFRSLGFPGFSP